MQAEQSLVGKGNKEYLPIQGLAAFNKATADLLLGPGNSAIKEARLAPLTPIKPKPLTPPTCVCG